MKKVNVIIFKDETENEKYAESVCKKLIPLNQLNDKIFCGIWGEIMFNNDECLKAISSSVNSFLNSDKTEVYFGCCKKDYNDIILLLNTDNCQVNVLSYSDL